MKICIKCGIENRKSTCASCYNKEYRLNNIEYYKSYNDEWRKANPIYHKIWRDNNPGFRGPVNKVKKNKRLTERLKTDTSFKLIKNLRNRLTMAIKNGQKSGSAIRDLGCTIPELKIYLESRFQPGMTWDNYGKGHGKWQIDHILPLASFDLSNKVQLLKACHYSNLQPLWDKDHIIKTINDNKGLNENRR